jgi:sugar phosphate isomerase/epimerase
MKIGAQMYTIRDYLKTPQEIKSSLKRLREIGYDMVQLSGLGPCDTEELAVMLKDNGIEAIGSHSSWEQMSEPENLKKLIEEHKILGCSDIGIGMKPGIYPDTHEGYKEFIKKINVICGIVKDYGMTFGYHNHEMEFEKFNGIKAIDMMAEECPDMKIILDVFWVQAGGENPSRYIDKFKDRIKIIHLKDFRLKGRERQCAELGEGNLDWNDIIPRCRQHGIPYAVVEQDEDFLIDPFESLTQSKKFLEKAGLWRG